MSSVIRKRRIIVIVVAILVAAIIFSSFLYLSYQKLYTGKVESISVGMEPNQVNLIVYVAENNYFATNGLNVTMKDYSSGAAAVNGLLNGEVNIATASEFVVARNAVDNESIQTFVSIDKFLQIYVIGNKDHGIENIADLEGKKVGLSLQTASQFYLGRFLELNRLGLSQLNLVNVPPSQVEDALASGTVDAVVAWQPYVGAIENRLGNSIWSCGMLKVGKKRTDCAISRTSWINSNPELVERFLNSLAQAKQYVISHPPDAKVILQNRLNFDAAYIETVWPQYRFSLSLDQSLIVALQDEGQWLISNHLNNSDRNS